MSTDRVLTHLSLFSGIGGLDLAAEMAGFVTVGQCEYADFPTKVLEMHWPEVTRWRDIRSLTGGDFYRRTGMRTVDVISGGFPCQPFSIAGKRAGADDDRYLWPEMLRVIRELSPLWVVGENVPGIINLALDQVLFDLEAEGYEVQTFVVPACGVDAPHRRERVVIVANAINGSAVVRRHRQLAAASETGACRKTNRFRSASTVKWGGRYYKPSSDRVAYGLRTGVHASDPHSEGLGCQGRTVQQVRWGGRYRKNLDEFLELTPLGKLGQMAPQYLEWLMGYPIGWTDARRSATL